MRAKLFLAVMLTVVMGASRATAAEPHPLLTSRLGKAVYTRLFKRNAGANLDLTLRHALRRQQTPEQRAAHVALAGQYELASVERGPGAKVTLTLRPKAGASAGLPVRTIIDWRRGVGDRQYAEEAPALLAERTEDEVIDAQARAFDHTAARVEIKDFKFASPDYGGKLIESTARYVIPRKGGGAPLVVEQSLQGPEVNPHTFKMGIKGSFTFLTHGAERIVEGY